MKKEDQNRKYQQAVRISDKVAEIIRSEIALNPEPFPIFVGVAKPLSVLLGMAPEAVMPYEFSELLRLLKICLGEAGEAMTTGEDTKGTTGQREIS